MSSSTARTPAISVCPWTAATSPVALSKTCVCVTVHPAGTWPGLVIVTKVVGLSSRPVVVWLGSWARSSARTVEVIDEVGHDRPVDSEVLGQGELAVDSALSGGGQDLVAPRAARKGGHRGGGGRVRTPARPRPSPIRGRLPTRRRSWGRRQRRHGDQGSHPSPHHSPQK